MKDEEELTVWERLREDVRNPLLAQQLSYMSQQRRDVSRTAADEGWRIRRERAEATVVVGES